MSAARNLATLLALLAVAGCGGGAPPDTTAPPDTLPPPPAEPDTTWQDTRLGSIHRLAADLQRMPDPVPAAWPAYYWNPPPGYELRYPVRVTRADGMVVHLPRNRGEFAYAEMGGTP